MKTEVETQFFFDEFVVDPARRVLLKNGRTVSLKPKTFDLLVVLVERRGKIISKNDLLDAVWENQFVEEKNLTVHIAALRKALGERKDENRFIVTVPGTGYKFVAELNNSAKEFVIESQTFERITIEEIEGEKGRRGESEKKNGWSLSKILLFSLSLLLLFLLFGGYAWQSLQKPNNNLSPDLSLKRLTTNGQVTWAALSPDANFYVYTVLQEGKMSLWLGQTIGGEPIQLRPPATGTYYRSIRFSADGGSFYYVLSDEKHPRGGLYKMPLFGGVPEKLRENIRHITYSPDASQIAFVRNDEKTDKSSLIISGISSTDEGEIAVRPFAQRFAPESTAWSPDGLVIAASAYSNDGNYFDVYAVTIADSGIKQLTTSAWNSMRAATWQTDGSALIVQADEGISATANWQIYEVAYPQGTVRRLINDLNSYNSSLSLSSDGKKLLTIQGQTIGNIWSAPAEDLSAAKQITFGSMGELNGWWGLAWTPDGKIIYTRFFDKVRTIWKMDANGGNQKQLIPSGGENFYPSVTSDGRYVVFQSTRSGKNEIWRANSDGSDLRQLTNVGAAGQPRVSPDGKWIIYMSGAATSGILYRISIDGAEPLQLTANNAGWANISPDSKFVACQYQTDKGTKLAIISIDGGEPLKLFDIPPSTNFRLGVQWFPDGKAVSYRDWETGIWKQSIGGGEPERLKDLPVEKLYSFDWSKDGKQFTFVRGQQIRDVILISNFR